LDWARLRTFRFAPPAGSGEGPGSRVEAPIDRQIRYLIASDLGFKGLRQASGREPAALEVAFSRRSRNTDLGWLLPIYDQYDFPVAWNEVDTRATLTVDIVDLRTNRLAWHAQTTKGIGPGITPGETGAALVREAVNEVLAGFPPRGAP
jgi:hypothetical protein